MNCEQAQLRIALAVYGDLPPDEIAEFQQHLAECPECSSEYHSLDSVGKRSIPRTRSSRLSIFAASLRNPQLDKGVRSCVAARGSGHGWHCGGIIAVCATPLGDSYWRWTIRGPLGFAAPGKNNPE